VSGRISGLRDSFPKETAPIQFPKRIERITNVPQGIEPLSIGGKRVELCLYNAQLVFERLVFLPGSLDLLVQWCQFLY
jgi:hypothetical protein